MKNLKKIVLFITFFSVLALGVLVYLNYPKLNILAGYSAKNTASSVFLAGRSLEFTDKNDNNFSPINLTSDEINIEEKSATGSVFGLLTRKAVYREGLGAVLINDDYDITKKTPIPKRSKPDNTTPFPYGNANQKDSIFKNINYKKLNNVIDTLFDAKNKTRSILVIYKDQIIAEKYADGFDKNSKQLGWSMTKSIVSTIVGIMQCEGQINVNAANLFEEWQNDERKNIALHNLLQMNSGLAWKEDYNSICDATKMLFLENDMTKTPLKKPLTSKPNENWNYSSGTTNLISGLIRSKFSTHQAYLNYWYSALIDKIGMNSMLIETDANGSFVGSSYGWATTRDWAKLGLLYLHNGQWNGKHLFDKDWVEYATTPTPTSDKQYGAQIWLNADGKYADVPKNMYSFNGYKGQNVFILPTENLVIVRTGLTKNADMNLFLKEIIASIKD
ncbi:serine hydrolase [Tenacibaculum finnmarkense genomovar finnmarkense]|uniref:serine hydrolase domain-containing protein n=1 Tax=Tenacibaculum finnmarkense TaxID=2781243 RepID=UPI001E6279DE|nr:serine hydrolase [Tenacibaculum finnmarkense]MCD8417203.1 beta-lactamase family protein [Tenacibaculum finnmarkense genomovar finnmarkense]MCG8185586.1 serine hydrolase [Tenacibaculum finnmarkense genomovar finnmarkense]MCG8202134.1 serine hydrolase [Tenacibaculum finnmarkense genomovar finnmarkense]MCG8209578.1 serine hydrolase [Tenacibaculum finnmarkense genomovar finnmarkense]MCG8212376.1 serine hydrolase [Tenacibaculum finnmarkense genomovar finnmarkense]